MKKSILIILFSFFFITCKKNQLGGTSTISGKVVHHSKAIPNATIFIKFDEKDFPGSDTTKYDDKVRADSEGNYTIKCYKGNYYLYGYGKDNSISPPYVVGGVYVKVRKNENVKADVAVTED